MPVQYTSKTGTQLLTPAPLAQVTKEYQKNGDGTIVGVQYGITLAGKILAHMGAPGSKATAGDSDSYQAAIVSSQKAIRELFADEGGMLEITAWDGGTQLTCYPRVVSIDFPSRDPVSWFNVCEYTINLEADYIDGSFPETNDTFDWAIVSASESIDFGEEDGQYHYAWTGDRSAPPAIAKVFRYSRTISAQGKKRFNDSTAAPDSPSPLLSGGEAWQQASGYVMDKLSLGFPAAQGDPFNYPSDATPAIGRPPEAFLGLPDYYNVYNHKRSVQIDKTGGSFSVTEEFIFGSGTTTSAVTEDTNVSVDKSVDGGLINVSVQGTITGMNTDQYSTPFVLDNHTVNPYTVASDHWRDNVEPYVFNMANALGKDEITRYIGGQSTLNPIPKTESVSRNPAGGTVGFNYAFDNRPTICVPGALAENITVTDNAPGQTVALTAVPGRILGPVMQDVGTQDGPWSRSLSMEVVVSGIAPASCSPTNIGLWLSEKKPSNTTSPYDQKAAIEAIILGAAPHGKPGVTKAFTAGQPSETWDAKNGRWTYSVTWNYELNTSKYY